MPTADAARIPPAQPPFAPAVQGALTRVMPPDTPPLTLFTTLARDERLFGKFFASNLLDRGHLSLRQRELVIDRTTALCGSEYEWGVHIRLFGARAGLDAAQQQSLVHGQPTDACWAPEDRRLLQLCDELHYSCTLSDDLWSDLSEHFGPEALLELLMLAGFYRTVSLLTNTLRLTPEPWAARFPAPGQDSPSN